MATTLIKTITSTGASTASFVDGTSSVVLDDTYKLYRFTFVDINPATDGAEFIFQCNAAGASGYNEEAINAMHATAHDESDSATDYSYVSSGDSINDSATSQGSALGTSFLNLAMNIGNCSDESCAGELLLFDPSNTTYVTHFLSRISVLNQNDNAQDYFTGGDFNITAAVDEIQFKMSSGNFDGTISLWGVA